MKTVRYLCLVGLLFASCSLYAAKKGKEPYIINRGGDKVVGEKISADGSGTITLTMKGGASQKFRKGQYKGAYIPKPKAIAKAASQVKKKDYAGALTTLDAAHNKYKYLGWAGYIGRLKMKCFMAQEKLQDAQRALDTALRFESDKKTKTRLKVAKAEIAVARKEYDEAERTLSGIRNLDAAVAPYVFNTKGLVLAAKGQKRDAVLEYLKTIRLYPKSGNFRKEAYKQVIAILKELNDNRYKSFEAEARTL